MGTAHKFHMIGEKRLYPTNRHAIAAFRKETGQAKPLGKHQ
jgi:hypothetical protein